MKVAIFGCLHGMLKEMYDLVERHEKEKNEIIELVLVTGDCQHIRHSDDLLCLSVPDKYKRLGDFFQYYAGLRKVPKLTICIGGNHEASNYLMTLPYGGWVCDNFYYMGYAGVVKYKGLRIAGVSGIFNYWNHLRGRYERMPLDKDTIKSAYHTRQIDIFRLQLLSNSANEEKPIDIFLSHDWPKRIYDFGNKEQLMRFKPGFRQDIMSRDGLGSPMTQPLVRQLKPRRWYAAHLHCRFYAKVIHDKRTNRLTEFLSLNKIQEGRYCMEVIDITPIKKDESISDDDNDLYYDEEWLTILRKTVNLENTSREQVFCPRLEEEVAKPYFASKEEIQQTINLMKSTGGLKIIKNFRMVEPVIYNRPKAVPISLDTHRVKFYANYQTIELKSRLKLGQPISQYDSGESTNPSSSNASQEPNIKQESNVDQETNEGYKINLGPNFKREPGIKQELGIKQEPVTNKDSNNMQTPPGAHKGPTINLETKPHIKREFPYNNDTNVAIFEEDLHNNSTESARVDNNNKKIRQ